MYFTVFLMKGANQHGDGLQTVSPITMKGKIRKTSCTALVKKDQETLPKNGEGGDPPERVLRVKDSWR